MDGGLVGSELKGQEEVEAREYKETQGNSWSDNTVTILTAVTVSQTYTNIELYTFSMCSLGQIYSDTTGFLFACLFLFNQPPQNLENGRIH